MKTFHRSLVLLAVLVLVAPLAVACSTPDGHGSSGAAGSAPAPAASTPAKAGGTIDFASMVDGEGADLGLTFTDAKAQAQEYIRYYKEIELTPEQERIKAEALSALPAPCCADNSLLTCCCPCNMAKSAWGLSAHLITERGFDAEQVRQAAAQWLEFANPDGYTGDACYTGGCGRSFEHNGCGGMNENQVL